METAANAALDLLEVVMPLKAPAAEITGILQKTAFVEQSNAVDKLSGTPAIRCGAPLQGLRPFPREPHGSLGRYRCNPP